MADLRNDRELGWDDEISKEGPEFVLLPVGDYDFEVVSFERARHNGSEKMPPCNKAILKIKIEIPEGVNIIQHNLLLHQRTEGFLSEFFTSIGQKKKGQPLKMNWNLVIGAKGRCKVGVRDWISNMEIQCNQMRLRSSMSLKKMLHQPLHQERFSYETKTISRRI